MKELRDMDVCRVISRKLAKDSGLNLGDLVLIMGSRYVPAKKTDPYLQRKLVVVATINKDFWPNIPGEHNDYKAHLMDPRSLELADEKTRNAVFERISSRETLY